MEKITIVGAGNGGFAAAADLTIRGHQVTLYEADEYKDNIKAIQEQGYIDLECLPSNGLTGGKAYVHKITCDVKEAFVDSDIIFVIMPSFGHKPTAKIIAPHIKKNSIVVLTPANFGGSIVFYRTLLEYGCDHSICVAEFDTMMYATRKRLHKGGKVYGGSWIRGYKQNLGCAVFPANNTDQVFSKLKNVYPTIVKRDNVVITGVSNINSYGHPPCMLGNIARIDDAAAHPDKKWLMNTGKTEIVCKLRKALDDEHMQLRSVGLNVEPIVDIYASYYKYQYLYEHPGSDPEPMEIWRNNPIYIESKGPNTWDHRYLTEDIPFGLVPIEALMDQYDLPHPTITAMINLSNTICGRNFREEGTKLKDVGIDGLSMDELLYFLETGKYLNTRADR